jgi:hypothetical protein
MNNLNKALTGKQSVTQKKLDQLISKTTMGGKSSVRQ